jgi:hypothetical protein
MGPYAWNIFGIVGLEALLFFTNYNSKKIKNLNKYFQNIKIFNLLFLNLLFKFIQIIK